MLRKSVFLPLLAAFCASILQVPHPAAAAVSPLNATRIDPYKNFKFVVGFAGQAAAGFSQFHKVPTRTQYDAITLERGITNNQAFNDWASRVHSNAAGGSDVRDVSIVLRDETSKPVSTWRFSRCWPSHYQAVPDLDAGAHTVAIETLELTCQSLFIDPRATTR